MAYNPDYYRDHREVAASLAQALWSGQSTVDLYHIHEQAQQPRQRQLVYQFVVTRSSLCRKASVGKSVFPEEESNQGVTIRLRELYQI